MRFLFKVATVFVCSLILIAFLAACGTRTENEDNGSSDISSADNTSKEENGVTDAVVSFGNVAGSGENSITNGSSSVNDNSNVSSNNSSNAQSNTSSNGETNNSSSNVESGNNTQSSKPGNGYDDPDSWTDPV